MSNEAIIFTDGACLGNPGPGGYAAVITIAGQEQVIVGRNCSTTNNKLEMTAGIKALEAVPQGLPIVIQSDSQYVSKERPNGSGDGKPKAGVRQIGNLC